MPLAKNTKKKQKYQVAGVSLEKYYMLDLRRNEKKKFATKYENRNNELQYVMCLDDDTVTLVIVIICLLKDKDKKQMIRQTTRYKMSEARAVCLCFEIYGETNKIVGKIFQIH